LGDDSRLKAALALREGELCVCQLIELLGLAPSTVSKHLSILKQAGVIESRKKGRWVYYRLARNEIGGLSHKRIRSLLDAVGDTPEGQQITRQLAEISRLDPETLCERQRCC
ncbi:MAG: transcriptional regulator, partial [Candidatus Zixiibacteriota bacterium]